MTTILYVDDSPIQLASVKQFLAENGHDVHTALDVEQAVQCMQQARIEFGLIDYHMPGKNGAEVLQEIRARANPASSVRFYLYTTDNKLQAESRKLGFHGVILRKGDMQALLAQLEPVLRLMELTRLAKR